MRKLLQCNTCDSIYKLTDGEQLRGGPVHFDTYKVTPESNACQCFGFWQYWGSILVCPDPNKLLEAGSEIFTVIAE